MPINRDLNASTEGDITTLAAGNWFQIRIVVGKKRKLVSSGIGSQTFNAWHLTFLRDETGRDVSHLVWLRLIDDVIIVSSPMTLMTMVPAMPSPLPWPLVPRGVKCCCWYCERVHDAAVFTRLYDLQTHRQRTSQTNQPTQSRWSDWTGQKRRRGWESIVS